MSWDIRADKFWATQRLVSCLLSSAPLCLTVPNFPLNRLNFTAKLLQVSIFQYAIGVLQCWLRAFDALFSLFLKCAMGNSSSAIFILKGAQSMLQNTTKYPMAIHNAQNSAPSSGSVKYCAKMVWISATTSHQCHWVSQIMRSCSIYINHYAAYSPAFADQRYSAKSHLGK